MRAQQRLNGVCARVAPPSATSAMASMMPVRCTYIASTTIAVDRVDSNCNGHGAGTLGSRDFMIVFGLLSSAFDLLIFAVLLQVFHAGATLQTNLAPGS
jgi:hypothetical protein